MSVCKLYITKSLYWLILFPLRKFFSLFASLSPLLLLIHFATQFRIFLFFINWRSGGRWSVDVTIRVCYKWAEQGLFELIIKKTKKCIYIGKAWNITTKGTLDLYLKRYQWGLLPRDVAYGNCKSVVLQGNITINITDKDGFP